MKQVNKLAAAIAVALSVGAVSPANAVIEVLENRAGDALIYPVFNGLVDNYYTVTNSSGYWIQGHLRFRGAGWSPEHRDFDVILSPGDVFVFRVADLDGDSYPEIDMTLDPKNFQYTSVLADGCNGSCMEFIYALSEPAEQGCPAVGNLAAIAPLAQAEIDHNRRVGYVEFIGEAILNGMTPARMQALLTPASLPGGNLALVGLTEANRTKVGNGLGTSAWVWGDRANAPDAAAVPGAAVANPLVLNDGLAVADRGLTGVPNVLMGSGFVGFPSASTYLAYNADTIVNFRTANPVNTARRVENYQRIGTAFQAIPADMPAPVFPGFDHLEVIVHNENSDASGLDEYVYRFDPNAGPGSTVEDFRHEAEISFNNTWGPTLMDGDDNLPANDYWDNRLFLPVAINSIDEVEDAIRAEGQVFESYYFDKLAINKGSPLQSFYFAHFPTKFYYGEDNVFRLTNTLQQYICRTTNVLLRQLGKPVAIQVWDINENSGGQAGGANTSPRLPEIRQTSLGHELSFFGVDFFKAPFNIGNVQNYTSGRAVMTVLPQVDALNFPARAYTFEYGGGSLGQWRYMHHY